MVMSIDKRAGNSAAQPGTGVEKPSLSASDDDSRRGATSQATGLKPVAISPDRRFNRLPGVVLEPGKFNEIFDRLEARGTFHELKDLDATVALHRINGFNRVYVTQANGATEHFDYDTSGRAIGQSRGSLASQGTALLDKLDRENPETMLEAVSKRIGNVVGSAEFFPISGPRFKID